MKVPTWEQPFGLLSRVPCTGAGVLFARRIIRLRLRYADRILQRVAKLCKLVGHVGNLLGDQMHDDPLALQVAPHFQQPPPITIRRNRS